MSSRTTIEDAIYRVIYGMILIGALSSDIINFPDIDPSTIKLSKVFWIMKISVVSVLGIFIHIFTLNLLSLDVVIGTGVLVIIVWLVILVSNFVFNGNKTHSFWFYVPIWLMPLTGISLIVYGMKFKVAKNEQK